MDDKTCPVCKLRCSRKDVMLRHYRNKHGNNSLKRRDAVPQIEGYTPPPPPLPPPPPPPPPQSNEYARD
jgi:hypothetical protein